MPAKSQADAIRDLEIGLAVLTQRMESIEESFREAGVADIKAQLAVLRHVVEDMQKRAEEAERRRWQVIAAGISSVLALAVNIILLAVKR